MAILPILKVIITIVRYFTLPLRENSLFYSPLAGELFILLSPCGRTLYFTLPLRESWQGKDCKSAAEP
jgi:hypothetical protein